MAILAGGLLVVPVPPPDIVTPPSVAYLEDVGTMTAVWVDPTGVEWPLSNTSEEIGWFTTMGPGGWGSTPIEIVTDPEPNGGEQPRFIRSKARRMNWPVHVYGETHLQFVQRHRAIVRAFTMTTQRKAHGWLRVYRPDGRFRQIACYYEEGWSGEAGQGQLSASAVVTLFCPDGYWSGDRPVRAWRAFTEEPEEGADPAELPSFFNPFMTVTSSKIISGGGSGGGGGENTAEATDILNPGDVDAWPTWTIRGPMSQLTAENLTLGSKFVLTYGLLDLQTITITTKRPSVRGPGSTNLSRYIDWFDPAGAELWPLTDGINQVKFRVDGAGTNTMVEMVFTPRHEMS